MSKKKMGDPEFQPERKPKEMDDSLEVIHEDFPPAEQVAAIRKANMNGTPQGLLEKVAAEVGLSHRVESLKL